MTTMKTRHENIPPEKLHVCDSPAKSLIVASFVKQTLCPKFFHERETCKFHINSEKLRYKLLRHERATDASWFMMRLVLINLS